MDVGAAAALLVSGGVVGSGLTFWGTRAQLALDREKWVHERDKPLRERQAATLRKGIEVFDALHDALFESLHEESGDRNSSIWPEERIDALRMREEFALTDQHDMDARAYEVLAQHLDAYMFVLNRPDDDPDIDHCVTKSLASSKQFVREMKARLNRL
jgi:hypothetical protein